MELRQLEAFAHVAEHRSFTRAAEILQTNQPALSRLVRQLEVELHQTLLVRNGRGAAPTAAGEELLKHCTEILRHVQNARDAMQGLQGSARQKFTLGLVPHIAKFAILSLVRDLRARFPRATITVVEGASTLLLESLLMNRIDAAILYETPGSDLIDKRVLLLERLYLVGPASSPTRAPRSVAFRDIARYPLVISSRSHAIREVVEAQAAKSRIRLNIALEVDAVTSVLDLVQEGYGHALLPLNALVRDEHHRALVVDRINDPVLHSRLVLGTSRRHPLSAFGRNVLHLLEQQIVPLYIDQQEALQKHRTRPEGTP